MKLLSILILLLFPVCNAEESEYYSKTVILDEIVIKPENYEQVILETLWKHGVSVDLSLIILAQIKFETANFTSSIFLDNNNCTGMKKATIRKTTCIGSNKGHAVYKNIKDSIIDYIYYMKARNISFHEVSIEKYVKLLKNKNYFGDSYENYYKGIVYYYGNLEEYN